MEQLGDSFRDTMAATLDWRGYWIPPFYIKTQYANASKASGRRPEPNQKAEKGMTTRKMIEYADHLNKFVDEPSVLCMDRLGSHKSKEVIEYIEAFRTSSGVQKFKVKLLPPKGAFLVSPLDFGFFGYWKAKYHKYDRSTPQLKVFAAGQAWKEVQPDDIRSFFRGCHLLSKDSEEQLRDKLRSQVRGGIPEGLKEVWDKYDGWLSGSYSIDGVWAPRDLPFEEPQQLLECELDGIYWNNWGNHGHSV